MKKKITQEQIDAINAEGKLVVVSANAGSGKTLVLVERIVRKLLDGNSIRDFLVVTFTNLAASEMKERIRTRILEESKKNPNLLRELENLESAFICTIDSFCMHLVKNNARDFGIPDNMRIAEDKDVEVFRSKAINLVFEEIYKNDNIELINFINNFSNNITNGKLIKFINKWLDFSSNISDVKKYIKQSIKNFQIDFENTKACEFLNKYIKNQIEFIIERLKYAIEICNYDDNLEKKYAPSLKVSFFELKSILETKNIITLIKKIKKFNFEKFKPVKDSEEKEKIKNVMSECKKIIDNFKSMTFDDKNLYIKNEVENFLFICQSVEKKIYEFKCKENVFEFSDIEKIAYKILKKNKNIVNFKEVIIDEFQDINEIQNKIFDFISEKMFIVGDYKQSIYGFRGALPEIFNSKKKSKDCLNFNLTKNFRNKKKILYFINEYFRKNMTKYTSEISYGENERLIYGSRFNEEDDDCVDVIDDKINPKEKVLLICDKIKMLMAENNKLKFSDFCIMCRNLKKNSKILINQFRENHIKCRIIDESDFNHSKSVNFLMDFLKILGNPYLDIPLIKVMTDNFFDFDMNEIFKIRHEFDDINLYSSIKKYTMINNILSNKCKEFLKYLNRCKRKEIVKCILDLIMELEDKFGKNKYYDKFLQVLISFVQTNNIVSVESFIEYISNKNYFEELVNFDNEDSVIITSIHKAKGKQFPICFIFDTISKNFVEDGSIIFDSELGIALNINKNIFYDAAKIYKNYKEKSEELRILYVAFTRAQEKLIVFI